MSGYLFAERKGLNLFAKGRSLADDKVTKALDVFSALRGEWDSIHDRALEDLFFLSDDDFAQWDAKDASSRLETGRPVLTVDQLAQHVHQVVNDIRMNTPTINVIPKAGADAETADIFKGLIKNIEYESRADAAYDAAAEFAVKSGLGFLRVDHEYQDDDSFDQVLRIKAVINPQAVYINGVEPDGSDATRCIILDRWDVTDFKSKYPNKSVVCFEDAKNLKEKKDTEQITLAEYFYISDNDKEIALTNNGLLVDFAEGVDYKMRRKVTERTVHRCLLSGADTLEETTFPGKYIPVIPVYGQIAWMKGERSLYSLIRKSKDAQRLYNFWASLETEIIMKQPNAPIMVAEGQIEDYAADWQNPAKSMALRYKTHDVEGNPLPAPIRLAPPAMPSGIVNARREAQDDIKASMGMYDASLGRRSNETSGVAIAHRQQEGAVATFHFGDNLVRSISQVGRVLVNAIPVIYDTPRILNIIGDEEEVETVGVNGAMAEGQEQEYNLIEGRYDVRVTTGASFTTQRQEAAKYFQEIIGNNPALMQVAGDLLFKYQDFPGAQAMAARIKKTISPELLEEEGADQDPQIMALTQQLQQAQAMMQEMQGQLAQAQDESERKDGELQVKAIAEQQKASLEEQKLQVAILKIRVDAEQKEKDRQLKMMEIGLKEQEQERKDTEAALKALGELTEPEEIQETGYAGNQAAFEQGDFG